MKTQEIPIQPRLPLLPSVLSSPSVVNIQGYFTAVNRSISASSWVIHPAMVALEKVRGSGIRAPSARKLAARKSISSCFCSGGNASAAASISARVLIGYSLASLHRIEQEWEASASLRHSLPKNAWNVAPSLHRPSGSDRPSGIGLVSTGRRA